ncbi:hypothetical protein [Thorsellia anophelis]|uniref:GIY-YIG nuclease family protein n=1 Tax=Thorsellia anophelis DSM 18579 TaxID=1123402 RepID=A0A1I0A5B6_9GAMM|nr:hypothetical protein [Thorsellia anophelis]SES89291.1 hypothetical protein SAMN02583745_00794 [Thorsellia anophelis DSM 18579]
MNQDNLYELVNSFYHLSGKIESLSINSFSDVLGSEEAKNVSNVIYFLIAEKPITRLKGESRILYIGQTSSSISKRYSNSTINKMIKTKANKLKYGHVLQNYGGIEIAYCYHNQFGDSLNEAEGQFLWWYFQNHLEYPPFNYTQTKNRNDIVI